MVGSNGLCGLIESEERAVKRALGRLTIVIEKMDEAESRCQRGSRPTGQQAITAAENATFTLRGLGGLAAQGPAGGSLSHGRLHVGAAESLAVWASHFGGDEPGRRRSSAGTRRRLMVSDPGE